MFALKFIITMLTLVQASASSLRYVSGNTLDDKVMEVTCLGKFTGVFHSFMYIESTEGPYAVRTPWFITYHTRVRHALKDSGLVVVKERNQLSKPAERCGWTLLTHMSMSGAHTGSLYRYNATNQTIERIVLDVLTSHYPSIEMAFTVIGGFIAFIVLLVIMLACGCDC